LQSHDIFSEPINFICIYWRMVCYLQHHYKKIDKWDMVFIVNSFIILKLIFFLDGRSDNNFLLNCILFFGSYMFFYLAINYFLPKK